MLYAQILLGVDSYLISVPSDVETKPPPLSVSKVRETHHMNINYKYLPSLFWVDAPLKFPNAAFNEEEEHFNTWLLLGTTSVFHCQTMSSSGESVEG